MRSEFMVTDSFSFLRRFLGCCLLLTLGLPAARSQVTIYATDTNENIYSVNPSTQVATLIGFSGVFLEGLAISPIGNLYGTSSDGLFYSLNSSTAAATLIGNTGRGNIEALDFNGNTLLGVSYTSSAPTLFSIDTTTGATTDLITLTSSVNYVRTMAAVDSTTVLIAADSSPSSLFSVNLATGVATPLGLLSVHGSQFAAMDLSAAGNLYGLDNDGSVWSINPTTASVTLLGNTGGQFWLDMTIQAIPEPSTYALLALGAALLGFVHRRRPA